MNLSYTVADISNRQLSINNYIQDCLKRNIGQVTTKDSVQSFEGVTIISNFDESTFDVNLKIHFRLESFVGKSIDLVEDTTELMNRALRLSEKFYRKNGLNLTIDATYDLTQDYRPSPVPTGSKLVYLRPFRGGTMNVLRWGLNPTWPVERRAKIYSHELTHFFDIPDEYMKDHDINTIETQEEDSFMNKWDHPEASMYLRHVTAILKDRCDSQE